MQNRSLKNALLRAVTFAALSVAYFILVREIFAANRAPLFGTALLLLGTALATWAVIQSERMNWRSKRIVPDARHMQDHLDGQDSAKKREADR